jgi:hypothetical protein
MNKYASTRCMQWSTRIKQLHIIQQVSPLLLRWRRIVVQFVKSALLRLSWRLCCIHCNHVTFGDNGDITRCCITVTVTLIIILVCGINFFINLIMLYIQGIYNIRTFRSEYIKESSRSIRNILSVCVTCLVSSSCDSIIRRFALLLVVPFVDYLTHSNHITARERLKNIHVHVTWLDSALETNSPVMTPIECE